jgi:hypothetical protein
MREYKRVSIEHPIIYTCMNSEGEIDRQGVGTALNISPNGMMVEASEAIHAKSVKIRASVSGGLNVETMAETVYCIPHTPNKYRTGFILTATASDALRFTNEILKLY